MKFATKKDLLKYLGKNENDRKLVDRLMSKWRVYMEWGMYVLVEWEIDSISIIRENELLKKENKNLKDKLSEVSNPDLNEELYEAKVQREYWEKECRRYWRLINLVIQTVYNRIKPLLWSRLEDYDTFREWIIEDVKKVEEKIEESD